MKQRLATFLQARTKFPSKDMMRHLGIDNSTDLARLTARQVYTEGVMNKQGQVALLWAGGQFAVSFLGRRPQNQTWVRDTFGAYQDPSALGIVWDKVAERRQKWHSYRFHFDI